MREIPNEVIHEVKELLSEGLTQREVALEAGVSLGTVSRVATGQRSKRKPARPKPVEETEERCGPIERCRGCGYRVEMPCLICQAREVRDQTLREQRRQLAAGEDNQLRSELDGKGQNCPQSPRQIEPSMRDQSYRRKAS